MVINNKLKKTNDHARHDPQRYHTHGSICHAGSAPCSAITCYLGPMHANSSSKITCSEAKCAQCLQLQA